MRRKYSDTEFISAVFGSNSWAEVFRKLGMKCGGGSQYTMRMLAKKLRLDTSHMTGQGWLRGRTGYYITSPQPLEKILIENSSYSNTSNLKRRLLKEGVFERKCHQCRLVQWNGKPIPLELEHKNGIRTDNRFENLTLLCPNCHAQTNTYCGKNIGRFEKYLSENGGTEDAVASKTTVLVA